ERASILGLMWVNVAKDLRLEWRSRDVLNSMLFFSLLVVVIFSFAFSPTVEESRRMAGGLVWTAFLFSTIMALNQSWARELRNGVLDAYRVSPAPAEALFLGKCTNVRPAPPSISPLPPGQENRRPPSQLRLLFSVLSA